TINIADALRCVVINRDPAASQRRRCSTRVRNRAQLARRHVDRHEPAPTMRADVGWNLTPGATH
ncbi:hypothetical protein LN454_00515, partial [Xanthomonas campestris]|uniref:hypothetical protein n=1 Tax=Xanthomonas campestris TaxID=339 RepID=UPI001E36C575